MSRECPPQGLEASPACRKPVHARRRPLPQEENRPVVDPDALSSLRDAITCPQVAIPFPEPRDRRREGEGILGVRSGLLKAVRQAPRVELERRAIEPPAPAAEVSQKGRCLGVGFIAPAQREQELAARPACNELCGTGSDGSGPEQRHLFVYSECLALLAGTPQRPGEPEERSRADRRVTRFCELPEDGHGRFGVPATELEGLASKEGLGRRAGGRSTGRIVEQPIRRCSLHYAGPERHPDDIVSRRQAFCGRDGVLEPIELDVERRNHAVGGMLESILEVAGFQCDVLLEQSPAEHAQGAGGQQGHNQERNQEVTRPPQPLPY
ncbi:MAG: hypothetical protein IMZ71_03020 [Chloroflexi bacterium]|nr:hypothetical protein [Chloroflexota bacterium]